jgi:cyclophilin family peptidyl-prolyl cis-trans isomerase/protein-disulfide isomerase
LREDMKAKHILYPILLAVLLLAACTPVSTPTPAASQPQSATSAPTIEQPKPATQAAPATPTTAPTLTDAQKAAEPTTAPAASKEAKCTVVSLLPTPGPTEASLFPPVSDKDWLLGKKTAPITFLEYSDFECPYCGQLAPVLEQLQKTYPEEVRVVFRHFPLSIHDKAPLAAQAAEAAGLQGKFWAMHDKLFGTQQDWAEKSLADFETYLNDTAKSIGLDTAKFAKDLKSTEITKKISDAQAEGQRIQLPGTPFLLISGRIYQGPRDIDNLTAIVKMLQLEQRQFTECPKMTIDPKKQYIATIKTEKGDIVMQLFADKAPMAVNSFIFLVNKGWYNNTTFHRVLKDFVAQGGDPSGTGYGGPGFAYSNETSPDLKFDKEGVVGLANSGPETNGSQFFITFKEASDLNGGYTILGQVIKGMDVARQLTLRDPSQGGNLPDGSKLISITIEEK